MFPNFPWTNFHRLNADWILQTVQNAVDTVTHAVERIESALSTVDGLTSRVTALEASTQQLQASAEDLDERVNGAYRRISALDTDIQDVDERVNGAYRRISALGTSVETLEGAMAGKVSNGNNTIIGTANKLTVSGVNSGEEVTINGTSVTITGTGGNDVGIALDTAGEPGASESVLRLVKHDDTSPSPVRVSNVAPGTAATDAVNVGQLVPISLSISGSYTNGTWSGATWNSLHNAVLIGKRVNVDIPTDIATRDISVNITSAVILRALPGPKPAYLAGVFNDPADPALLKTIIIYDDNSYEIK